MPITIISKEFTDEWGNSLSFDRSNALDKVNIKFTVTSEIRLYSQSNPFIYNGLDNQITSGGVSFLDEGFREGDNVTYSVTTVNGNIVATHTTTIVDISEDGMTITLGAMPFVPDITQQGQLVIYVIGRNRQSIEYRLNYVDNSVNNNDFSLIDGEATRFMFSAIDVMAIGSTQSAEIVGNQSGQYLESASLKRIANISTYKFQYELYATFYNSGAYDASWFASSDCLKPIIKMLWSSLEDEPFSQTQIIHSNSANTGWFDQPHNSDAINATLIQGISEIDYAVNTPFTIVVDGLTTDLGIGCSYIPKNDEYYKNKPLQQGNYGMVIPTSDLVVGNYFSLLNPDGAGYEIEVTAVNTIGSVTTINGQFIPNSQLTSFMQSAEDGDREFYLWVKCGNLNLRAFKDQLTTSPPVGGELIMETSKAFYDHSVNESDGVSDDLYEVFDTEDDLAYYGEFLMEKGGNYDSLRVRIEAFNDITLEDFTLKEVLFSFAGTQINSDGIYLIDQTINVNPSLPNTSLKREAYLKRQPIIDSPTEFGMKIYYPIVLDWRYWLEQLNANSFFYPDQNKDWQGYSQVGDWGVRMEIELIKDGLSYTHSDGIIINPYDNDAQVTSYIELIDYDLNTPVGGFIDGKIILIKVTHVNLLGSWSSETWGNIHIERKEGEPFYMSSTVVPYDNNSSNPLFPLPGESGAKITLIGNIATVECLCDTTKLIGTGLFSVAPKIKDPAPAVPPLFKTTAPDDVNKTTTYGDFKTLA